MLEWFCLPTSVGFPSFREEPLPPSFIKGKCGSLCTLLMDLDYYSELWSSSLHGGSLLLQLPGSLSTCTHILFRMPLHLGPKKYLPCLLVLPRFPYLTPCVFSSAAMMCEALSTHISSYTVTYYPGPMDFSLQPHIFLFRLSSVPVRGFHDFTDPHHLSCNSHMSTVSMLPLPTCPTLLTWRAPLARISFVSTLASNAGGSSQPITPREFWHFSRGAHGACREKGAWMYGIYHPQVGRAPVAGLPLSARLIHLSLHGHFEERPARASSV